MEKLKPVHGKNKKCKSVLPLWETVHALTVEDLGSIPGQGNKILQDRWWANEKERK